MNAVSQMHRWGPSVVAIMSRCNAPRKNSSSLNPASTPTISIDTISDPNEGPAIIMSVAWAAASSIWRNQFSRPAMDSGRCIDSFQCIIRFRAGAEAMSVSTAIAVVKKGGFTSTASSFAGRRVESMAAIMAGIMNTSISCTTVPMRIPASGRLTTIISSGISIEARARQTTKASNRISRPEPGVASRNPSGAGRLSGWMFILL